MIARLCAAVPADAWPGLALIAAAALAMALANSSAASAYAALWLTPLGPLDLGRWIGDGLMASFFFQVGLEVKREIVAGDLSTPARRRLPLIVAAAGMAMPAAVYLLVARADPAIARGWAIPAATDIAFALGVLALLGRRVPSSLRLFLTTLAVADDIGAVAIIAFGYTRALDPVALGVATGTLAAMVALSRAGVRRAWPYLGLAVATWAAVLASGVHPTVAGVLAAMAIPVDGDDRGGLAGTIERAIAPWVSYAVLPLFAFAHAGVAIGGAVLAPLPLAIAGGLFLGKQAGVFGALRLMVALGLARPPDGATWPQLYGVALLSGIGFTMSLFIADLAFADPRLIAEAKTGVLAGSILSAIAGALVLRIASAPRRDPLGRTP